MPSLIRPRRVDAQKHLQSLFLRTEKSLVDEIARKLGSGYVDYAERAALKRVQETLMTLENECFKYVPLMVQEKFIKANKDLHGYSNAEALSGLSATQNKAIETLVDNLLGKIDEAAAQTFQSTQELMVLGRLENDVFRTAALSAAANAEAGMTGQSHVTAMVTELETQGITAFVDKAGRHWSLRDYGNMAVRTTARQAEVAAVLTADDWDLWQIVKIGSTCPLCASYEGRVYSKSGTNPNYPPLSMAFGKIDPAGGDDLSNTYLNIHPNCLHTLIKFTEMGKSDKQLQKIREFSSPITNPTTIDPRTKAQREAYNKKVNNRARLLREMRKKQGVQLQEELERDFRDVKKVTTKWEALDALEKRVGFHMVEPSFDTINTDLMIDNTNRLLELEDKFGIIGKSKSNIQSVADGNAGAFVSHYITEPTNQDLSLCPIAYKNVTKAKHVERILYGSKKKTFMPLDDAQASVYNVTHEYGHMVQNYMKQMEMEARGWDSSNPFQFVDRAFVDKDRRFRWYLDAQREVERSCYNELVQIARDADPAFSIIDSMSKYGLTDEAEFFAEAFANAYCGAPNALGKAMKVLLKRRGLI